MRTKHFSDNHLACDNDILQFVAQQPESYPDPCPTVVGVFINGQLHRKIYCDDPSELIKIREYLCDIPTLSEIKIDPFSRYHGCDFAFQAS